MPAGVPVGTLAIGKAGATNAGLLAAAILATSDDALATRLDGVAAAPDRRRRRSARMTVPPGSTIGILGGGQLGRMLALAAAQLGYRMPHLRARRERRRPPRSPPASPAARSTTRRRSRRFAAERRRRHLRIREYRRRRRSPRSPREVPLHPPRAALEIAQDRLAEKAFIAGTRRPPRALRRGRRPRRARRRAGRDRRARDPQDPPLRL